MNIDYSRFDQIVHAFLTDDKSYEGDPNWDMGEEFQLNILSSLVSRKYGGLLYHLCLDTYWKYNTYFDKKTGQFEPDAWFALAFTNPDGTSFPHDPYFLIKFHFNFERVLSDIEYRNLVAETVSGTELDRAIEKACKTYELFYRRLHRRVLKIASVADDTEALKKIRNVYEDPTDILGTNPIEITI